MRSAEHMTALILDFANRHDDIRAVWMNGSRTNPHVAPDIFQDFDIVYAVRDTAPYIRDTGWISTFGDIAVMQQPDASAIFPPSRPHDERYAFLMQFTDGNRIDLTFVRLDLAAAEYQSDRLVLPLLDKDEILPPPQPPTDIDYHVKKPSGQEFSDCCNEFYWVAPYVAKGICRDEVPFAMEHLNLYMRDMLTMMLGWYVGTEHDFAVSIGKGGKYLKNFLPQNMYQQLLQTYFVPGQVHLRDALFAMMDLFAAAALAVAKRLDFTLDTQQEQGARSVIHLFFDYLDLPQEKGRT